MTRRRGWRVAACVPAVVAAVLVAAACEGEVRNKFPRAFPGTKTDVSSAQALSEYGIATPAPVNSLGYYAWAAVDGYPMAALFTMRCDAVPDFVVRNRLREVAEPSQETIEVELFAEEHGWVDSGAADTRYIRPVDEFQRVEVLIHRADDGCRVYIDALTLTP